MSNLAIHENKIYSLGDNAVYTIPTIFSPPTLWLRADAGVEADGDNLVNEWQDQSGNDYHAEQSSQVNKPLLVNNELNGKPVLRFNGNQVMQADFQQTFSQPNTFFCVWNVSTPSSTPFAFGGINSSNRNSLYWDGSVTALAGLAGQLRYTKNAPFSPIVNSIIFNHGSSQLYENGNFRHSENPGNHSTEGITIGARWDLSRNLNGDIAEIIFYNSLLSDTQRQSVENYLINKYALL